VVCFRSETYAIFSQGEFIATEESKEDSTLVLIFAYIDLQELCFAMVSLID
jgi:hypothetical protein